ncbi:hypothetical protein Tdes44962_MAKER07605 [Teratosphaeria destructans]|uniref:ShKT domain-containing protein n=1 Tax=Teratosphaeria destructans TaxID=418781 RepID=A0A9W7W5L4_9PEZI|nr:hypothetical protein Tdes44962_MAKER07605 [Teratosphaeria destructans]
MKLFILSFALLTTTALANPMPVAEPMPIPIGDSKISQVVRHKRTPVSVSRLVNKTATDPKANTTVIEDKKPANNTKLDDPNDPTIQYITNRVQCFKSWWDGIGDCPPWLMDSCRVFCPQKCDGKAFHDCRMSTLNIGDGVGANCYCGDNPP